MSGKDTYFKRPEDYPQKHICHGVGSEVCIGMGNLFK